MFHFNEERVWMVCLIFPVLIKHCLIFFDSSCFGDILLFGCGFKKYSGSVNSLMRFIRLNQSTIILSFSFDKIMCYYLDIRVYCYSNVIIAKMRTLIYCISIIDITGNVLICKWTELVALLVKLLFLCFGRIFIKLFHSSTFDSKDFVTFENGLKLVG